MIPVLQRLIDISVIPLWILAIVAIALAAKALWFTCTKND